MKTKELMTKEVLTCAPSDSLNRAAQIMWERDVGCVPVVSDNQSVIGMITDRDICMSSYTQGRPLSFSRVGDAMSGSPVVCSPEETVHEVAERMRRSQVRRLPVVEDNRLVGVLSLNDIALASKRGHGIRPEQVALVLAAVSEHRELPPLAATAE